MDVSFTFHQDSDAAVKRQPGQRRKRPRKPFGFFPAGAPGRILISLQQETRHQTPGSSHHSAVLSPFGAARPTALKLHCSFCQECKFRLRGGGGEAACASRMPEPLSACSSPSAGLPPLPALGERVSLQFRAGTVAGSVPPLAAFCGEPSAPFAVRLVWTGLLP